MSFTSDDDLNTWKSFRREQVTPQMMIWQRDWPDPCGDICCYSDKCGSIHCDHCYRLLTSGTPLPDKFVCMECPPPKSSCESVHPTLCAACFHDGSRFLHPHARFCRTSSRGEHSVAIRASGVAEKRAFQPGDFRALAWQEHGDKSCPACFGDFDASEPPAAPMGCAKGHTIAVADPEEGMRQTGTYYHVECYRMVLQHQPGVEGFYCGDEIPVLCPFCVFERSTAAFRAEFELAFSRLDGLYRDAAQSSQQQSVASADLRAIFATLSRSVQLSVDPAAFTEPSYTRNEAIHMLSESLTHLHRQPWLRNIITNLTISFQSSS